MVRFAVFFTIVFLLSSTSGNAQGRGFPKVGKPAPRLEAAEWIQGKIGGSDQLKGKTIILEFWATWCAPCIAAIPHLNELAEEFAADSMLFISISNEKREDVERFLRRKTMKSSVAIDRVVNNEGVTLAAYGVRYIPRTFLIGSDGLVKWHGEPDILTSRRLETYLRTGQAPKISQADTNHRSVPVDTDIISHPIPNTIYSFTISNSDPASHNGMILWRRDGDTVEIQIRRKSLLDILTRMLNKQKQRFEVSGSVPADTLDISFRATLTVNDSIISQRILETLCDRYAFTVNSKWLPRKAYVLSCPDSNQLVETHKTRGSSSSSDSQEWHGTGFSMDKLCELLESTFDIIVVVEACPTGRYDFDFPHRDFTAAKDALQRNYGLSVRRESRDVEMVILDFERRR